jgi:hypothetical protein
MEAGAENTVFEALLDFPWEPHPTGGGLVLPAFNGNGLDVGYEYRYASFI